MTERFEERLLKFIAGLLSLAIENMWSIAILIWAATSIFSLDEILYVKAPTSSEKAKTEQVVEKKDDGPKPGF